MLNKALYGLKQAPRAWFDKLKSFLLSIGFQESYSDTSFFFSRKGSQLLIILVYVDDLLITGDDAVMVDHIIQKLNSAFSLKHLGEVNYFLGLEAHKTSQGYLLNQTKYINDLLHKTNMSGCTPCPTPYCSNHKLKLNDSPSFVNPSLYRSTIGALQYLTITRPDLSFIVNKLSQFLHSPTSNHWVACKRVLRYLKGSSSTGLIFGASPTLHLTAFSNADWGSNLDDRKSTSGHCVFLGHNLIAWSSKKQSVVGRSSTEAEYRALASVTTEVVWIKSLFVELGFTLKSPTVIWCDNESAISLASNPVFHAKTKHIEIDVHYIRDKVCQQEVDVRYVPSKDQVADTFT
ncbi:hypothetical protein DH2020_041338 [Rehmannia glutinosa]|uniref:Reverse transcriptase Ty1/copia-type domain-containing protein n=1 Tax=Rehmannia glutinosa TaxID=99300 RepID=A0ABR0URG3_REHGL